MECKRLIWFMAIRGEPEAESENYEYVMCGAYFRFVTLLTLANPYRFIQVALLSAKKQAPSLIPYLIFDGAPNELTAWFERNGGHVIFHSLSFAGAMWQVCRCIAAFIALLALTCTRTLHRKWKTEFGLCGGLRLVVLICDLSYRFYSRKLPRSMQMITQWKQNIICTLTMT